MKKYILALVCMITALAAAAQATVTGTVYEPTGDTAIGASVYEKGNEGKGAVTDIDGNFTLKVSSLNATIVVSYVGLETQEVPLNGRSSVEVHMKEASNALTELVVVGYGTQKKINATGAVKTIDNEMLESRPLSNAVQGLQGAVAGLNITNDAGGAPGSEMAINIRGVGSIGDGSNASPLILIDGMEGDLASINPNDIESISVLKDAAAASIYGSRAPFGVVLVTTKGGQRGTRVNYTGNVRFQTPMSVPNSVDSYTMALMVNDGYTNSGNNPPFSKGYLERILNYQAGMYEFGTEAQDATRWKTNFESWGNTDWYDVYMKKVAVSQEHNASVTGGGDKVTYYFSGNYLDQSGIFKYADESYKRLALTGKVNVVFNDYVRFNWTSRLINTQNNKPSALNSLFYHNIGRRYITIPLYLPNGEYHPDSLVPTIKDGGREKTNTLQVYNQANLVIEPIKGWQIHAEVNSRIENNPYTRQFKPIYYTGPNGDPVAMQVLNGVNARHNIRANGTFDVYPAAGESYYEKAHTKINYFSTNIYTDYKLTLKEKHNFTFLLGMQTEYFHREIDRMASTNVVIPDTPFLPSESGGEGTMISESKGEWSSMGFFGRVNYNYDDRYMLEVNMRGDGASRFPKNQRWGYFPSVSVGWNVAQESFWQPIYNVWNYFKLRGSYGVLGNQNTTSFYPFYQQMTTSGGNVVLGGNQANMLPVYAPYSSSLTWEKIENAGAGVDFAFFNSRLQGAFDWYQRTTKDMVGPAMQLPGVFGGDAPKTNNAELRTRGWEVELSWRDRIGKDFNYSVSASLSDYKTVVTKYDSPTNAVRGWYQGKTYGEIWGYEVVGIAKSDKEMADYQAVHSQSAIGNNWGGGDLMYRNLDDDPNINTGAGTVDDHGDLKVIGNTTPRLAYSFTLEAQWKFIDFRAYFQGIGKRDFFIGSGENNPVGTSTFFAFGGGPWQFTPFVDHLDYFRYAGSELGANMDSYYGRLRTDANNIQYCDRFVQDASYLRLKNLTIGFTLPKEAKISKWVQKARLYFSAENLFTFTKLKIFDPEALNGSDSVYDGGAGKTYPQYRTYSVGLELTF
ncbi:MAG: TonB-dependent receptor [Muribaculaceae bacterium]|nr:TonB-dependent receptor [Muribaculaceae bacterium]